MAHSLNKVMVIGNLGSDPEIRATHSEDISEQEAWRIADRIRRKYLTGFLHDEAGRYLCKAGDPLRDDRAVCDASSVTL